MKDEIQHILSGKSQVKHHHLIQATCSYLKRSQRTSSMAKDQQQHKEEETKILIQFAEENNLWVENKPKYPNEYLGKSILPQNIYSRIAHFIILLYISIVFEKYKLLLLKILNLFQISNILASA
jgi:hypothetical protein